MTLSLEKRAEKVGIVLSKRNINNVKAQVKLAIDRSGSMNTLYNNHTVQDVVERILAIGMKVDMDKVIDVWAFHHGVHECKSATVDNIEHYVDREIVRKVSSGATSYGPVMEAIITSSTEVKKVGFLGGLFHKKEVPKPADPVLGIFITDGQSDDEGRSEKLIKDSQDKDIYWMLVGIGESSFPFLKKLADKYPNCGYTPITDIAKIDDDDLFELLLCDEFAEWVKKFA